MEFCKSFGWAAGVVLGTYVGVKAVIEIESHLSARKRAKQEEQKQERTPEQKQAV
ncbi:hypothetical protein HDG36_002687 [Paraburkholderia sp. Kb1A]|uniref:hypothetical protein n=1 Tax=unclassified Paraburkholderia TaxID=2615204 RepID=UPI00161815DB|nr:MULTISPECIES: hypothetical protein [unclassified Paraburkholderia]MBB5451147.1 hypothetical protein [Paraburkholderia sp. Kb1A]